MCVYKLLANWIFNGSILCEDAQYLFYTFFGDFQHWIRSVLNFSTLQFTAICQCKAAIPFSFIHLFVLFHFKWQRHFSHSLFFLLCRRRIELECSNINVTVNIMQIHLQVDVVSIRFILVFIYFFHFDTIQKDTHTHKLFQYFTLKMWTCKLESIRFDWIRLKRKCFSLHVICVYLWNELFKVMRHFKQFVCMLAPSFAHNFITVVKMLNIVLSVCLFIMQC